MRVGSHDHVRLDGRLIRQRAAPRNSVAFICHRSPGEDLQPPAGESAESGEIDDGDEGRAAPDDDHASHGRADHAQAGGARTHSPGGEADHGFTSAVSTWSGEAMTSRLPKRAGRRFIPISPMPRIDGGLELVTADGELAARLQRSVRNLTSEFSVRVKGELGEDQIASLLQGTLDSGETLRIEHCEPSGGEGANKWYVLGARGASGKEVRQLFERQGALVSRVLRTSLGPLILERTLARGRFRELTEDELSALTDAGSDSTRPDS